MLLSMELMPLASDGGPFPLNLFCVGFVFDVHGDLISASDQKSFSDAWSVADAGKSAV